jgi:hypothetical protein
MLSFLLISKSDLSSHHALESCYSRSKEYELDHLDKNISSFHQLEKLMPNFEAGKVGECHGVNYDIYLAIYRSYK